MKVKVVLNAKNVYCNADKLAEYLYELNYCDVKKLDEERVELVFDQVQLKRIYDEYYTLEYFLRDAIAKNTEAAKGFTYTANLNDIVERVDVEFKDVYFADEVVDAVVEKL